MKVNCLFTGEIYTFGNNLSNNTFRKYSPTTHPSLSILRKDPGALVINYVMRGVQDPLFWYKKLLKSFRYLCGKLADQCKYVSDFTEGQTVSHKDYGG